MIAEQLDAGLAVGRVTYLPPYGVRVEDARLTPIDRGASGSGGGRNDPPHAGGQGGGAETVSTCHAANDPAATFCRRCGGRL